MERTYDYHGGRMTLTQIAEVSGKKRRTLQERMYQFGMTAEQAADAPDGERCHWYAGEFRSMREITDMTGARGREIEAMMHDHKCTAEEAVNRCYEKMAHETGTPCVNNIVRKVLKRAIYFDPEKFGYREIVPGKSYGVQTDTYDIRAEIEGWTATLTATVRKTGKLSLRRRYRIFNGNIYERM